MHKVELPYWTKNFRNVTVSYTDKCLNEDIKRIREVWHRVQASRERGAIYDYLDAVYGLVRWWTAEGQAVQRAKRALLMNGVIATEEIEPYAAVIAASVAPGRLDRRKVSKYARVLRFAEAYKPPDKRIDRFLKRHGGLNCCAAEFSRRLGRQSINS